MIVWFRIWPLIYTYASFRSLQIQEIIGLWILYQLICKKWWYHIYCENIWKCTSFSQSLRIVMMANITVWMTVPPMIIPAQIPCRYTNSDKHFRKVGNDDIRVVTNLKTYNRTILLSSLLGIIFLLMEKPIKAPICWPIGLIRTSGPILISSIPSVRLA